MKLELIHVLCPNCRCCLAEIRGAATGKHWLQCTKMDCKEFGKAYHHPTVECEPMKDEERR